MSLEQVAANIAKLPEPGAVLTASLIEASDS
jgi:hypothetical protein